MEGMFEILISRGFAVFASAGVMLALAAPEKNSRMSGAVTGAAFNVALLPLIAAGAAAFLYINGKADIMAGQTVSSSSQAAGFVLACFMCLAAAGHKAGPLETAAFCAAAAAFYAAAFYGNASVLLFIAAELCLVGLAVAGGKDTDKNNTVFGAVIAAGCALLFVFVHNESRSETALSFLLISLMMLSSPGRTAFTKDAGAGRENHGIIMSVSAGGAFILAGLGRAEVAAVAAMALGVLNFFRAVTEENYGHFSLRDACGAFFIMLTASFGAGLSQERLPAVFPFFVLSAAMNYGFLAVRNNAAVTVGDLKYGEKHVSSRGLALFAVFFSLLGEVLTLRMIWAEGKMGAAASAAVMIFTALYAVYGLNKLFIILSMLKRESKKRAGRFIELSAARPAVLLLLLFAAMAAWRLK